MDLKISKMTWVHERNKFEIFLFLFHEKMAQFEENSILQEVLCVFQNGTPARLALCGVAQREALLYLYFGIKCANFLYQYSKKTLHMEFLIVQP